MIEVKNNEHSNDLKEVNRLCKKFDFTAAILKNKFFKEWGWK